MIITDGLRIRRDPNVGHAISRYGKDVFLIDRFNKDILVRSRFGWTEYYEDVKNECVNLLTTTDKLIFNDYYDNDKKGIKCTFTLTFFLVCILKGEGWEEFDNYYKKCLYGSDAFMCEIENQLDKVNRGTHWLQTGGL